MADDRVASEILWQYGDKSEDEEAIKRVVYLFNKKLIDIYSSGGLRKALAGFPGSKNTRHEIFRDLGTLKMSGKMIIYDMANFKFTKVEVLDSRRAVVDTYEEWNHLLQDARTRKPIDRIRGLDATFRYELLKTNSGWTVMGHLPTKRGSGEGSN